MEQVPDSCSSTVSSQGSGQKETSHTAGLSWSFTVCQEPPTSRHPQRLSQHREEGRRPTLPPTGKSWLNPVGRKTRGKTYFCWRNPPLKFGLAM